MSRLADIEARLASLEREAALLRRFGDDARLVVGDVIRFTKRYPDTPDDPYLYAAIKTPKGWYTTASPERSRPTLSTYDQLIQFIVQHPVAEDVEVAVSWVDVTEVQASPSGITNDVFVSPTYPDPLSRGSLVSTSAPAEPKYDVAPLPRRRAVEFGRGLYRPVEDDQDSDPDPDPEPEVQTPVRDPSR